MQLDK